MLRALGAEPVLVPTIALRPVASPETDAMLSSLGAYDWILCTSPNTVRFLCERLSAGGTLELPLGPRVAAIGAKTAAALQEAGARVDLIPREAHAEGLLAALPSSLEGARILLPRAREARELLPDALRARGAVVAIAVLYENVLPEGGAPDLGEVDAYTFASGSAVENFFALYPDALPRLQRGLVACIGPVTAEALRARGVLHPRTAPHATLEALCSCLF